VRLIFYLNLEARFKINWALFLFSLYEFMQRTETTLPPSASCEITQLYQDRAVSIVIILRAWRHGFNSREGLRVWLHSSTTGLLWTIQGHLHSLFMKEHLELSVVLFYRGYCVKRWHRENFRLQWAGNGSSVLKIKPHLMKYIQFRMTGWVQGDSFRSRPTAYSTSKFSGWKLRWFASHVRLCLLHSSLLYSQ
jgi:hypothetical protein